MFFIGMKDIRPLRSLCILLIIKLFLSCLLVFVDSSIKNKLLELLLEERGRVFFLNCAENYQNPADFCCLESTFSCRPADTSLTDARLCVVNWAH